MKIELHRHTYNGQPQGLSLRLSRGRCIAKTAFHNVGAAFHRRPQDFAKADTGIRKKRHAPTTCSNSVCPAHKKRAGTETRPYKILSKSMSGGQGCFYCQVKAAIPCAHKADSGIRKKRHAPTACSNSVCPAAQKTGGHRDPPLQDFIQVDVGRTRLFLLPSKSRDLPCGSPHRLFIF